MGMVPRLTAQTNISRGRLTVNHRASAPNRVVHHFDFDERNKGNLEDIPKYWEPLRPKGFPHYVTGLFDDLVGHEAPPSFHLKSEARNVVYQYIGPATRVRTNTDYRLVGYVKPDRLTHARACLSAHFLDKNGRPISETLVRSRYIGEEKDKDRWVMVELHLAAAPPEAYTIAIGAWVLQKEIWRSTVPKKWHIPRKDIKGGAWFDDITLFALPRVSIATSSPGNIIPPRGPYDLDVVLADNEDPNLKGRLSILAADGKLVETHAISVVLNDSNEPNHISTEHLSPGLYHAWLEVFDGEALVVSRSLTFARLAPKYHQAKSLARSFGVVIDENSRSTPEAELALLSHHALHSAKIPIWTGIPGKPSTPFERKAIDTLYQALVKRGFSLTAVFVGPPSVVAARDGAYIRPLIELLNGDQGVWIDYLAAVVAPYASVFHWWQIGADRVPPSEEYDELEKAADRLREAMSTYLTRPRLTLPRSTTIEPSGPRLPYQQLTLVLREDVSPMAVSERIKMYKNKGYEQLSAYLEPRPFEDYRRLDRLRDWAIRVLHARHTGVDTVFVPQTWRLRETPRGVITEPDETYLLLRTMADILGDAKPGPSLRMPDNITALSFHDGQRSILALWDPDAPPEGRKVSIQLGQAEYQFDLWGRSSEFKKDDMGRHIVHLSSMPILIPGVERWLIDFRSALVLEPEQVESGFEVVKHDLFIRYQGGVPVSGTITIKVPKDWKASPTQQNFSVLAQRIEKYPLEIRYPHNEPAGKKLVTAHIYIPGVDYHLEVPLTVQLGVKDLQVWGAAVMEGAELILRHVVTNQSKDILSFRGSATVPGRARLYRPIANLKPGDTQIVEYRLRNASKMIGRHVRLMLREVNDGPRIHSLDLIVP